jgi:uncharacterized protein
MSEQIVTARELVEESKRRGYLAKQLYVVFTTPVNGIGPVMAHLASHLEFQEKLERDGIMFAAGRTGATMSSGGRARAWW